MKINVVMPKMGESIIEGTLIKWHKKKGDSVQKDEILYEISTDKVDTEIPSPESGVLSEIKVFENETVEVNTVVAIIDTNGDTSLTKSTDQGLTTTEKKFDKLLEEESEFSTTQVGGELIDIPMPKMGESVMDGTIIKWHKKVGDKIERDEILFEISTDKVDTEVPAPIAGIVAELLFKVNDTVDVGETVARISTSGGLIKTKKEQQKHGEEKSKETITTIGEKISGQELSKDKRMSIESNRFYSPLVMNIAKKENVTFSELESIIGSGVNGRVTKKDILNYLREREKNITKQISTTEQLSRVLPAEDSALEKTHFTESERTKIIPMDNIRQRIMYHMENSRDTSVHVTAVIEVDMFGIHEYIQKNKEWFLESEGIKLTYMPFISYACIKALKQYPYLNASIDDKNIVLKKFINLGIAVAVEPNGLIVPNIKNADEKSVVGLAKAISELSFKSRNKGLLPDDIMDGTFTITNYGVFGTMFGTPIINQPEVAVLGVGTIIKKPVVIESSGVDSIAIKPMMYLSLSHDHRLVDGMLGGLFLKSIKETLENFDTSIV